MIFISINHIKNRQKKKKSRSKDLQNILVTEWINYLFDVEVGSPTLDSFQLLIAFVNIH